MGILRSREANSLLQLSKNTAQVTGASTLAYHSFLVEIQISALVGMLLLIIAYSVIHNVFKQKMKKIQSNKK